jgi:hypothetical protein
VNRVARHAGLVLFTICGVPLLVAAPFLLFGFIGKP